jgi:hypothetical protein
MSSELIVLLSDREVGRVRQDQRRRLKFIYMSGARREALTRSRCRCRSRPPSTRMM